MSLVVSCVNPRLRRDRDHRRLARALEATLALATADVAHRFVELAIVAVLGIALDRVHHEMDRRGAGLVAVHALVFGDASVGLAFTATPRRITTVAEQADIDKPSALAAVGKRQPYKAGHAAASPSVGLAFTAMPRRITTVAEQADIDKPSALAAVGKRQPYKAERPATPTRN